MGRWRGTRAQCRSGRPRQVCEARTVMQKRAKLILEAMQQLMQRAKSGEEPGLAWAIEFEKAHAVTSIVTHMVLEEFCCQYGQCGVRIRILP